MHKIISFDGGGIRGVLTAAVLECLAAAHPSLIGNATLLAGTSAPPHAGTAKQRTFV